MKKRTLHSEDSVLSSMQTQVGLREYVSQFEIFGTVSDHQPQDFMWFCHAVVRWQNPSAELNEMFAKVSSDWAVLCV